jgi:hypothetical protein
VSAKSPLDFTYPSPEVTSNPILFHAALPSSRPYRPPRSNTHLMAQYIDVMRAYAHNRSLSSRTTPPESADPILDILKLTVRHLRACGQPAKYRNSGASNTHGISLGAEHRRVFSRLTVREEIVLDTHALVWAQGGPAGTVADQVRAVTSAGHPAPRSPSRLAARWGTAASRHRQGANGEPDGHDRRAARPRPQGDRGGPRITGDDQRRCMSRVAIEQSEGVAPEHGHAKEIR